MTREQMLKNLQVPSGMIDVVLDTDAYNEIDDQFAIAYMLSYTEKLNVKAIYAAPFFNSNSSGPEDGMEKSYDEILNLLDLCGRKHEVFKGSASYLPSENTAVESPAATDLIERAKKYSPEKPLYVVAIGAITNVASALLICPEIAENMVVVWLGGHGRHYCDTYEFNMRQDIAASRVVMTSGVPFVQLPCVGVVSQFAISKSELEVWMIGKNKVADYLAKNTIATAEEYASGTPWTRVIWDVTAIAWLVNDDNRFMLSRIENTLIPGYDSLYESKEKDIPMGYVYHIERDALMADMINKIVSGF